MRLEMQKGSAEFALEHGLQKVDGSRPVIHNAARASGVLKE